MKEDYTDIIQQVSQVVFEAIKEREENLSQQVKELDGELAKLLRLIGREVEAIANLAESFVEKRLLALDNKFKNLIPPKRRSGWNRILVELDGCQIRTGSLMPGKTEELTPLRRLKKRKRQTD